MYRERHLGKDRTVPGLENLGYGVGYVCQLSPIIGRTKGCKENLVAGVCFDMLMDTPVSPGLRTNKEEAIGHVSSSQETERDDAVLKLFAYVS